MPRQRIVYLKQSSAPDRRALQEAVDRLGFDLQLDHGFSLLNAKGYQPCTLDGEDAGFDLRSASTPAAPPAGVAGLLGDRDAALTLRWAGDPREELAALAVCVALAENFGALVHDPDTDAVSSAEALLAAARKANAAR